VTSKDAKKRLSFYVRNQSSQYMGGVWESVHHWNADFIAVKWDHKITEFEIKVSRADLRSEIGAVKFSLEENVFEQYELWGRLHQRVRRDVSLSTTKVEKHHHYLVERKKDHFTGSENTGSFRPNLFYFAVPHVLVDYAIEQTQGLKYGVFDLDAMRIVSRGSKLHDEAHSMSSIFHLFSRACTLQFENSRESLHYIEMLTTYLAEQYGHEFGSLGWIKLHKTVQKFNQENGLL
jgi:hypothetical protein